MKYLSVCSGIEAASVAWKPLGWQPVAFSEIEAFPCSVLAHHYPDTPNWGDMTCYEQWPDAKQTTVDLLCGGTPCFTAGHLVLTATGYRPIEEIQPGELVVTHMGRLRPVVRVGSKHAPVGVLKGVGLRIPLTTTADHPFLSVDWRMQSTHRNGIPVLVEHCSDLTWAPASEMPGRQWCALTNYEPTASFAFIGRFSEKDALYLAGMYLGDGHIRKTTGKRKKGLVLSLNEKKLEALNARIGRENYCVTNERTSVRATIYDTQLCEWLQANFGELSHLKRIPAWLLGHKHKAELLDGYMVSDGHRTSNGLSANTASPALAYGLADLLNASGYVAAVGFVQMPAMCVIEGRTVNQRSYFHVSAFPVGGSRKSRGRHGYLLRTVKSFTPAGEAQVFNIEVADDHSFVLNGAVVHNCQSYSTAGLRRGLDDPRGQLMLTFGAIARRYRPRWLVWENVPGVLSSHGGRDFGAFLGMLAQLGYGFAYRVLDAQCVRVSSHPGAVPQRRRRVFVVGHSGGCWQRAAAVLFERESLRGHPAPCGQTRKTVAALTACGVGTCGADDNQGQAGHLVAAPDIPDIVGQAMCSKWAKGTSGPAGDEHHNLLPVRPQGERSYRGNKFLKGIENDKTRKRCEYGCGDK